MGLPASHLLYLKKCENLVRYVYLNGMRRGKTWGAP